MFVWYFEIKWFMKIYSYISRGLDLYYSIHRRLFSYFSVMTGLFFTFLLFPVNASLNDNTEYASLLKRWDEFQNAGDHEKDYQTNSFLRYLEQALKKGISGPDSVGFLPAWESDTTRDGSFSAHASYVSFDDMPDRVFYCLQRHVDQEVYAFSHTLKKKYKAHKVFPELKFLDGPYNGTAFSLIAGGDKVFEVPDLQALMLIESLSRTRGGQASRELSDSLSVRLKNIMEKPEFFEDDFSDLRGISTLLSSDDKFKIVTWNMENLNGEHRFYGLVGFRDNDSLYVRELNDNYTNIQNPESVKLDAGNWYGAIYYEIIPVDYQGQNGYTLLGYNGKNAFTRSRIIDFMGVSSEGDLFFGAPVFEYSGERKHRLIFEYSNQANMMLRYEDKNERIVMDHLAPRSPEYEGDRSYYGPDFSYDALEFIENKWLLNKDVDVRNR